MSDSSVLPSGEPAPAESPDIKADRPATKARKSSKSKGKNKSATTEPAVAPAALRKSASWCIAQLDSMVRTSVNAALARTQIESMTIRGYWVLEAIADGGDMAQTELSALLGMDRSDMVRLIDSLEAADLVARTRDAKDRRRQLIALTQAGNTTRASLRRSLRRAERAAVAECSPEVRTLLASLADGSAADQTVSSDNDAEDAASAEDSKVAKKSETNSDAEVTGTVVKQEQQPKRKKSKKKKGKKKKKGAAK
ncbi:MAG: MarR family winged helix-turn-helix transcriptional regulator [Corynebacterium sp.]|uniref:MarR family winged helix-turn-helix transcriptional regulator n=1 Tax=Corynebacterium sp. TaxID=1720 RepID=UPI0026DB62D0|nr:MarR family winged helix-turn-helix transcriptional regulator [Corynebacterium sp.]MDO5030575.1 MarR family winged helix-turn-helix transcriptional regulator [Corynebacterium sp.]